jgi:uncharacterized protein YkwD
MTWVTGGSYGPGESGPVTVSYPQHSVDFTDMGPTDQKGGPEMDGHGRRQTKGARSLATGLFAALLGATLLTGATTASAATAPRLQMRWLTNHSRIEHSSDRLHLDSQLSSIAARHSRAMALRGTLFHTPNVPRELRGRRWFRWGENVGMTNQSLPTLEWGFMNSVDHRRNILDERFRRVGIGIARTDGVYWVTVIFYG